MKDTIFENAFRSYLISRYGVDYIKTTEKNVLKRVRNAFKAGYKAGEKEK